MGVVSRCGLLRILSGIMSGEEGTVVAAAASVGKLSSSPFVNYDETQYPRAAEESETESGGITEEELLLSPESPIPSSSPSTNSETISVLPVTQQTEQQADMVPIVSDNNNTMPTPPYQEITTEDKTQKESKEKEIMSCGVCFQLLLDPVTLTCGHSFCQVCLAQLWTASHSAVLLCPMCRQPWAESGGRLPSVNVIFREVLEHSYPEKIKERREALTQSEQDVIHQYTQGAAPSRHIIPDIAAAGRRQFNINIVSCLIVAMVCSVILIVTSVILSILLVGGASGDHFIRKPVSHWNNDDVMQWIKGLGDTVQKDAKEIFVKEKIDGRHLTKLTMENLNEYGMTSELSRNSLLLSIEQLKESQYAPPRNFHEFMTANKEEAVLLLLTYKIFPRLTFGFVYMFHYYDIFLPVVQAQLHHHDENNEGESLLVKDEEVGGVDKKMDNVADEKSKEEGGGEEEGVDGEESDKNIKKEIKTEASHSDDVTFTQLVAIFMEILLVPHLVVAMYAATGLQVVPALASIILLHCIVATLREVKDLRNKLRTRPLQGHTTLMSLVKTSVGNFVFYVILLAIGQMLCLILPPIFLDIIFYLLLFNIVYSMIYTRIIRPSFQRIVRFGARILVQFMNR